MRHGHNPAGRQPLDWLVFGGGVVAVFCALAPLALAVAGTRLATYDSMGAVVNACVRTTLHPRPLLGLSWRPSSNPKIERSTWIRVYPGFLCGKMPRLRILPAQGLIVFPAGGQASATLPAPPSPVP